MSRIKTLPVLLIIVAVIICLACAVTFYKQFSQSPAIQTECYDSLGNSITYTPGTAVSVEYNDCIQRTSKLFIDKDYELAKDLSKSFLTLLAGLLVASITFSEKIVNLQSAGKTTRSLMICCWVFLLVAITTCGVGLALMTMGAGWASYQPFRNFRVFEPTALYLFITSGLAFGCGLISLLVAGILAIREQKPSVA